MDYKRECLNSMIQFADLRVDMLKTEREEYEKVVFVANKMLKFQWFVPLIIISIGFLIGGLSNISNFMASALYGGLCGLIGTIPTVLIAALYWGITKKRYNKKLNDINNDINVSLEVKKTVEEEITKLNERKNGVPSEENTIISVSEYHKMIDDMTKKDNEKEIKRLTLKKR